MSSCHSFCRPQNHKVLYSKNRDSKNVEEQIQTERIQDRNAQNQLKTSLNKWVCKIGTNKIHQHHLTHSMRVRNRDQPT